MDETKLIVEVLENVLYDKSLKFHKEKCSVWTDKSQLECCCIMHGWDTVLWSFNVALFSFLKLDSITTIHFCCMKCRKLFFVFVTMVRRTSEHVTGGLPQLIYCLPSHSITVKIKCIFTAFPCFCCL